MDWTNERYVRLYTRDTDDWLALKWEARALFVLLLRKVDRSGFLETKRGAIGVAAQTGMPLEIVGIGLPDLLRDGSVTECDGGYLMPNYIDAQEAPQSDAQRARESRERRRDRRRSHPVTPESRNVIEPSHAVTPRHTVSLQPTYPSQPNQTKHQPTADGIAELAIELTRTANAAISARFGEQPNPLRAGHAPSHTLAREVLEANIPVDFAMRSVARQAALLKEPVGTMWYFHKGIQRDWSKQNDKGNQSLVDALLAPTGTDSL